MNVYRGTSCVRIDCRWWSSAVAAVEAETDAAAGAGRMWSWALHGYGASADASQLRLEKTRMPRLWAPGQVLVRVHAASINPLDVAMIRGYGSRILNTLRASETACCGSGSEVWGSGVEFPLVLGRDFLGIVEAVGPGATDAPEVGASVWGVLPPHWPGALRQYVVAHRDWVGEAPARLGLAAAGAPYAGLTAVAALRAGGLRPERRGAARGARALVLGLGGVGAMALQLLVAGGARAAVGCAAAQDGTARALGAADVLHKDAPDYEERLVEGGPYDLIVDCAGLGGDYAAALRWRFSRYVTLTTPLLRDTDSRGLLPGALASAAAWVRQAAAGGAVRWAYFYPSGSALRSLRRLADEGRLSVPVAARFPWRAADGALRAAAGGARGKVLVDFTAP